MAATRISFVGIIELMGRKVAAVPTPADQAISQIHRRPKQQRADRETVVFAGRVRTERTEDVEDRAAVGGGRAHHRQLRIQAAAGVDRRISVFFAYIREEARYRKFAAVGVYFAEVAADKLDGWSVPEDLDQDAQAISLRDVVSGHHHKDITG
jgi:hypothetical protein